MSYDVYFYVDVDGHQVCVGENNYTSNVSGMWSKALQLPEKPWLRDGEPVIYQDGRQAMNFGVRLLDDAPSSEAAGVLAAGVARMEANPDDYTPMNPDNGWGCYEGALDFLRWMAETASKYPSSRIVVSS